MDDETEQRHPLFMLDNADLELVLRLVLASGSLKDLATQYGISYPTVRIRLDRLIEKVRILEDEKKPKSPFHRKVQLLVAEGRLDLATARTLIKLYEADH
jgi:hypothetical protein